MNCIVNVSKIVLTGVRRDMKSRLNRFTVRNGEMIIKMSKIRVYKSSWIL